MSGYKEHPTPEGPAALAEALKVNKTLTRLDVSGNQMKAEGAAALADGLKSNCSIQVLAVSGNGLSQASKDELTKHKPPHAPNVL